MDVVEAKKLLEEERKVHIERCKKELAEWLKENNCFLVAVPALVRDVNGSWVIVANPQLVIN